MRQYRGKRKDNRKWVYGYPVEFEDMTIIFECGESTLICKSSCKPLSYISSDFWVEVDPATVGQKICTFNKKDFYEGDKVSDNKGRTGYIRYRTDPISMEYEIKALTGGAWYDHMGPLWSFDELEIIGNVHSEVQNES